MTEDVQTTDPVGADAATGSGEDSQGTTDGRQDDLSKVDITRFPKFREIQSTWNRQVEEARAEAKRVKDELEQIRLGNMDDAQKRDYELQKLRDELNATKQQAQQAEFHRQAMERLNKVTSLGVPESALNLDGTELDMFMSAIEYISKHKSDQGEEDVPPGERPANKTDLGSSKPSGSNPLARAANEAAEAGDTMGYLRAVLKARAANT